MKDKGLFTNRRRNVGVRNIFFFELFVGMSSKPNGA